MLHQWAVGTRGPAWCVNIVKHSSQTGAALAKKIGKRVTSYHKLHKIEILPNISITHSKK